MDKIELVALVIQLRAAMPTYIENHMGRAVQRFGLTLLDAHDSTLAQTIHDTDDLKPFTVSTVMGDRGILYKNVAENTPAWIRITGLSAKVAAALIAYHDQTHVLLKAGERVTIELDRLPWQVEAIHIEGHPWAGKTTYQQLIDLHREHPPDRQIKLHFQTPTTFRRQQTSVPLPLPDLVLGSLLSRWAAFTSHQLHELPRDQVMAYIENHVLVSQYETRTSLVRGKKGGKEIGFVGKVTYELTAKSAHLERYEPDLETLLQQEGVWFARTLSLFAHFAFYGGIGRKTTTGMGMVRQI